MEYGEVGWMGFKKVGWNMVKWDGYGFKEVGWNMVKWDGWGLKKWDGIW